MINGIKGFPRIRERCGRRGAFKTKLFFEEKNVAIRSPSPRDEERAGVRFPLFPLSFSLSLNYLQAHTPRRCGMKGK